MPDSTKKRKTKTPAPKKTKRPKSAATRKAERTETLNKKYRASIARAVTTGYRKQEGAVPSDAVVERTTDVVFAVARAAVYGALPGKQNTVTGEVAMTKAIKAVCAVVRKL